MKKVWCLAILLIFPLSGAKCVPGGAAGTRYAVSIKGGASPVRWTYTADGDEPAYCEADMWLVYVLDTGETVEQEGLKMIRVEDSYYHNYCVTNAPGGGYYVTTNNISLSGGSVTGEGGRLEMTGKRSWSPRSSYVHSAGVRYRKPPLAGQATVYADSVFGAAGTVAGPYHPRYPKYLAWGAEAYPAAGNIPSWASPIRSAEVGNLLPSEHDALCASSPPPDDIEYTCTLIQQCGKPGEGYTREMPNGFVPFNLNDSEDVFRYAAPLMYSYLVTMPEPLDITQVQFEGILTTGQCPEGIRVGVYVVASNLEKTVYVLRTDYFLPVEGAAYESLSGQTVNAYDRWTPLEDPNAPESWYSYIHYDEPNEVWVTDRMVSILDTTEPNFIVDEIYSQDRVRPMHVIPVGQDDTLEIEFVIPDVSIIMAAAPYWLNQHDGLDTNKDGIVNLWDLFW